MTIFGSTILIKVKRGPILITLKALCYYSNSDGLLERHRSLASEKRHYEQVSKSQHWKARQASVRIQPIWHPDVKLQPPQLSKNKFLLFKHPTIVFVIVSKASKETIFNIQIKMVCVKNPHKEEGRRNDTMTFLFVCLFKVNVQHTLRGSKIANKGGGIKINVKNTFFRRHT